MVEKATGSVSLPTTIHPRNPWTGGVHHRQNAKVSILVSSALDSRFSMLRFLSSACVRGRWLSARPLAVAVNAGERSSPLFSVLGSFRSPRGGSSGFGRKMFFCSERGTGFEPSAEAKAEEEARAVVIVSLEGGETEKVGSKASSAIVCTNPPTEDYSSVIVSNHCNSFDSGLLDGSVC